MPSAIISKCGDYRYRLEREGDGSMVTSIIMVNPSMANGDKDDHTISTLRGFGRAHGWGKLIVGNLFAYRAADVRKLATVSDPVGPCNDFHLEKIIEEANQVVYAWGALSKQPKHLRHRWLVLHELVLKVGHTPLCLGEPLKDGHPHHPQHLSQNCGLRSWNAALALR